MSVICWCCASCFLVMLVGGLDKLSGQVKLDKLDFY
jgi:hypothetical protein